MHMNLRRGGQAWLTCSAKQKAEESCASHECGFCIPEEVVKM